MRLSLRIRLRVLLFAVAALLLLHVVPGVAVAAPAPPQLSSPTDGSPVTTLQPTVSWLPSAGANSYQAELADNPAFNSRKQGAWSHDLSFTWGVPLTGNTLYYWRVRATGYDGTTSDYSAVWRFWTPLSLVSPADGSATSLTPNLDWSDYKTGSDTAGRSYRLQVARDSGFTSVVYDNAGLTSSAFAIPAGVLVLGQTYYWHVQVSSSVDGTGPWSEVWGFYTPPSAPTLVSPGNGDTIENWRPILRWNPSPGATEYRLNWTRITATGQTSGTIYGIGGTSYEFDTYDNNWGYSYQWSVEARNSFGGATSEVWSFNDPVVSSAPAAPVPVSPGIANGPGVVPPVIDSLEPTFSWGYTSYTKYYKLVIATDTGFGSVVWTADKISPWTTSYTLGPGILKGNTVHYWKVISQGGGPYLSTSQVWTFKTPPPPGPTLLSPANSTTPALPDLLPTLSWTAQPDAASYQLQVAKSSDVEHSPKVVDTTVPAVSGASYTFTSNLDFDAVYYWRVNFTDGTGTSLWSETWAFRGPPPPVPFAPVLQSPGSPTGGSIVGFRPAFVWSPPGGATNYSFELATDSAFTSLVGSPVTDLVEPTFPWPTDLAPDTDFYWRVMASNSVGDSDWASPFSFTTPPPPPAAPTLTLPASGSTTLNLRPHFDWSDSAGATSYSFELFSDPELATQLSNGTATSSEYDQPSDLAANTTYYWHVRAANGTSGPGAWSTASSFTTPVVPLTGKIALSSPANGADVANVAPTLSWQADPYATGYRIQISVSGSFTGTLAADTTVAVPQYSRPSWAALKTDTVYYWRVAGTNSVGTGEWSDVWTFHTPPVPGVPSLVSPIGVAVDSTTPRLVVSTVPWAAGYTIQLSQVYWFSGSTVITINSPTPEVVSPALAYGKQYFWKARASNAVGTSAWSDYKSFTTPAPPPPPVAPTPVQPILGAVVDSSRPTLDWNDVPGATGYEVAWTKSATFQWTEASYGNRPGVVLSDSQFTLNVDLMWGTAYFWRVRAIGLGGVSPWSTIAGFKTPAGPPGLPVLLSPAMGANADGPSQKLDWTDAKDAAGYRVQLSTDAAFGTTLVDTAVVASEYVPASAWPTGTAYYWRVMAVNGVGDSGWTEPWSFTVPPPPGQVALTSPENGATLATLSPTLGWGAVTGAAGYELKYSQDAAIGWGVTTVAVPTAGYTVATSLPYPKSFYWKVRALNGGGEGPWSEVWSFSTPSSPPPPTLPPAAPVPDQPANGAIVGSVNPTFSWSAAEGATQYYLQLSRDSGFSLLFASESAMSTTHTLATTLSYSTLYYWRVKAHNVVGDSYSAARSFTAPNPPPPPAPTLIAPADNGTTDSATPMFDWSDSPTATSYRIQLSATSDFGGTLLVNQSTSASTYTTPTWRPLSYNTQYHWRVQGNNSYGAGEWSPTASFTTPAGPPVPQLPPVPALTSPGGPVGSDPLATADSLKPAFSWLPSAGATGYSIQISKNASFTSLLVNAKTTGPGYSLGWITLAAGAQYWWRALATSSAGSSDWSGVYTFVTPGPPPAPTLESPTNGTKLPGTAATLVWNPSNGATSYQLMVSTSSSFWSKVVDTVVSGDTTFSASGLAANATYYWRVAAINSSGTGPWSATRSFMTGSSSDVPTDPTPTPTPTATPTPTPTPGTGGSLVAPTLISPGSTDGSGGPIGTLRPTFTWTAPEGAAGYTFRLSRNVGFSWIVSNIRTTGPSYSVLWSDLAKSAQFWWKVQVFDSSGASAWSDVFTFTTPSN